MGLPLPASRRPAHDGARRLSAICLKEARELAQGGRRRCDDGIDPIVARGPSAQIAASALTVEEACESYITAQRPKWRTARHVDQIKQRLRDFVFPVIGHLPIADIRLAEAKQVLAPIWTEKNPTAGRVRQYMEDATDWAIHEGIRADESNPWEVKRLRFALPLGIHKDRFPVAAVRAGAGVPGRAAHAGRRQGPGAGVRDADARARRRYLRRRQGAHRADAVEARRLVGPRSGPSPTPRWAGRMSCR